MKIAFILNQVIIIMKHISVITTSIFLSILISVVDQNSIQAQDIEFQEEATFRITGNKSKRVIIPFDVVNNLIIISASINGSEPLRFILDSGAWNTLITGLPNNEQVYLNNIREVTLSGLGEGKPVEAIYSNRNRINIGRVEGRNLDIFILKEDVFHLSSLMGTYVHGIIGYDFFANFAVEINYLTKEIFLYDLDEFENKFKKLSKHRKWHKYPLNIKDKKPYMDLKFKHKPGGGNIPLHLLVDTGSSNAFSLYELTHDEIKIPNSRIKTLIGVGLSGNVNGYLGRIEKMKLGNFIFNKPIIAYPDSMSINRAITLGDRNGSIGGEVMRRFKTILNYRDGYILMRKNKNYKDDFYYNVSGIEVNTPFPDLPYYEVSKVRENSPADLEGIKVGDVIIYINGKPSPTLSLNDVIGFLSKKQGSSIRLEIQRENEYKRFLLQLKNELQVDR
ncbi:MAG: aspartyl protease family protein [Balneolaceae bacterium]